MDKPKIISIYAEMTPNPLAMKFVADRMLLPEGAQLEFLKKEDAESSPVAQKLFDLPFVKSVYITTNFITVLKNDKAHWDEIVFDVRDYIKEFIQNGGKVWIAQTAPPATTTGKPIVADPPAAVVNHARPANEVEEKIVEVLDSYVKPAVENDGGMILFHSFKDGIVTLQLKGSCSGCPSSTLTLKSSVEQLLKNMVPEVKEVQQEIA
ncbi:MAG TPA: NifU family protein [Bacteroidia bacterium]|jgi:Fe-S cluster biogenesis protein NfuA|nr:NifU family protein [Bacteroidia bacterium]